MFRRFVLVLIIINRMIIWFAIYWETMESVITSQEFLKKFDSLKLYLFLC